MLQTPVQKSTVNHIGVCDLCTGRELLFDVLTDGHFVAKDRESSDVWILEIRTELRGEEALNARSDGGIDEKLLADEPVASYS